MRKHKIAVFGLGSADISEENKQKAFSLGRTIALKGHYLITGLAKGITEYASKGAKSENGIVIGINPHDSETVDTTDICYDNTDIIINTGIGDRGRNVISVRTCDAMIVIDGNFGVLNEITNGIGENKPIVVLQNSGGVADLIETIVNKLKPDYKYFKMADSTEEAVDLVEKLIESKKLK